MLATQSLTNRGFEVPAVFPAYLIFVTAVTTAPRCLHLLVADRTAAALRRTDVHLPNGPCVYVREVLLICLKLGVTACGCPVKERECRQRFP
jgi:hypothetical protein